MTQSYTSTTRRPKNIRGQSQQNIYYRLVRASHAFYAADDERIIAHIPLAERADKFDYVALDQRCGFLGAESAHLLVQDIRAMNLGRDFILSPGIERFDHRGTIMRVNGTIARPYSGLKIAANGAVYTTFANGVRPIVLDELATLADPKQHIVLAIQVVLPDKYRIAGAEIKQRFDSLYKGVFLR